MSQQEQRNYTLALLGPFRLTSPDGTRIEIPSRKGMALLAMLALAKDGERTRGFLREKLWGSRDQPQALASMRRELSNLRQQVNTGARDLLVCEHDRVRLNLDWLHVDVHALLAGSIEPGSVLAAGEFLEGIDLPGESGFEDWLRDERLILEEKIGRARKGRSESEERSHVLPSNVVDVSQPTPGFGGRPALAVLSFRNLTGDPSNDYLSEGVAEELIDRLSRLRWLPVIARASSFSAELENSSRAEVGRRLGAKYILDGRLRRPGGDFQLSLDLTEAESGVVIWSQRLQLPHPDSPEAMEQLASDLVAVLDSRIDHAEQAQAHAKPRNNLDVNDLIWRGRWHLNRITREDASIAGELFDQALAIDANSPEALIQKTFSVGWSLWAERKSKPDTLGMRRLAQRAIVADAFDGRGHMLAGIAELWLRHYNRADALLRHAIELNPSLSLAYANLGSCEKLSGRPGSAIEPLKTAMRLSPSDMHLFYVIGELAASYCMLGNWREALDHADLALIRRPAYWYAYVVKINALVRSGNPDDARAAYEDLLAAKSGFTNEFIEWLPFADRKWNDYFIEGVVAASKTRKPRTTASRSPSRPSSPSSSPHREG